MPLRSRAAVRTAALALAFLSYDNQPGEPDDSPAATPLAGGSIGAHGR